MVAATREREKRLALHLPVDVRGQDPDGGRVHDTARSLNISGGGICFEGHIRVPVGSRLTLDIQLPEALRKHFGGKPVYRAQAVVCRVERMNGSLSRIGARFLRAVEG
jgi:PilZ domain